jgi:hypothetical protein
MMVACQGPGRPSAGQFEKVLGELPIGQVACGAVHALALTTDARVFSWGCNGEQLRRQPARAPASASSSPSGGSFGGSLASGSSGSVLSGTGGGGGWEVPAGACDGRLGYAETRPVTVPREVGGEPLLLLLLLLPGSVV